MFLKMNSLEEHARVYIFGNNGHEKMYLSSADWMTRNLDKRVEVAVPIMDEAIRAELRWNMELQWADNTQARKIDVSDNNTFIENVFNRIQDGNKLSHTGGKRHFFMLALSN